MKNYKQIALAILKTMPVEKIATLKKALERNFSTTSSYMLERACITEYEEGWYVELSGVRSGFKAFYDNKKNRVVRKPNENKLHKVHAESEIMDEGDFYIFHSMRCFV